MNKSTYNSLLSETINLQKRFDFILKVAKVNGQNSEESSSVTEPEGSLSTNEEGLPQETPSETETTPNVDTENTGLQGVLDYISKVLSPSQPEEETATSV